MSTQNLTRPAGNGGALGMPTFGGYADLARLGTTALPCAFAGSVNGVTAWERHADVAIKSNQGTHVWSPPT